MTYNQITSGVFESGLLQEADIAVLKQEALAALDTVKQSNLPILTIAKQTSDLEGIISFGQQLAAKYDNLVVIGTGGSSLCPATLVNLGPRARKVIFLQNIDPFTFEGVFAGLNLAKTAFLVTSKSGETIEALTAFNIALQRADKNNFWAITTNTNNPLRRMCTKLGIPMLEHDPKIGGRFSILANVGLIPAVFAGVDVTLLRQGAADFYDKFGPLAAESAAIHVALMRKNIWQNVLLTYLDKLAPLNTWYRQIWAESLGKNGAGSTPIRAVGTIDQHSQLQLYLGGRKDKFFSFVSFDFELPTSNFNFDEPQLAYLNNKTLADVLRAEEAATTKSLLDARRPIRVIKPGKVGEHSLGMVIMHLMLETIITANLLGLNAFDQPAVENGKVMARQLLGSGE
jgi:glucose-6-phosphate isomerase